MIYTTMTYNTARLRNLRGTMLSICQPEGLDPLHNGISACVESRRSAQQTGWALLNNDALSIIDVDARVLDGTAKANAYVGVEGGFSEPSHSWSRSRMRKRKQGKQQT